MLSRFYRTFFLVFLCVALICGVSGFAHALDMSSIRLGLHGDKERVVIELTKATKYRSFVLQDPNRIVLDIDQFNWKIGNIFKPVGTLVKDVRYGVLGGGKGRLVIETNAPVILKDTFSIPKSKTQPDRIVIDFSRTTAEVMKEATSQKMGQLDKDDRGSKNAKPAPSKSSKNKEAKLIIIDPGHGGQDPGAIGANGAYEKNIVLAVGLELRKQLRNAGYRVEMTREKDVFIPLRGRVNFARKKKGDLFISLHADSIGRANVAGASVYTLSDKASDKETQKLAERENKSDLIAGIDLSHQEDDVAGILIDLAARDTMNQSRYLAKTVINTLDGNSVKILDKKYRSAGFAVLKAMDIPSVLVEMGYLTNRQEVERLSSSDYQKRVAAALKQSVDSFFRDK